MREIKRVAVLGAGVMGRAIAAHVANAGYTVDLLDRVLPDTSNRNQLAEQARTALLHEKPAPLFIPERVELIRPGNFSDDLDRLAEADWIIEAVIEQRDIKQQLFAEVEHVWNGNAIISSNTSGIPIAQLITGRSTAFQQHFLGTHFFNPPRYMKLLELIPTAHTLPEITDTIQQFAQQRLGKGVVIANDTPNFIANRIGTYSIQVTIQAMEKSSFTPTVVDALTGTLLGRPKSATFRTLDIVGLDTYAHVVRNMQQQLTDPTEIAAFQLPSPIEQLLAQGALGEKTKQGFYRKLNGKIQALNLTTGQYELQQKPKLPILAQAKKEKTLGKRLQTIFKLNDPVSHFLWDITKQMLLYTAHVTPSIANTFIDVDRAMRWGFNWDLGPFELWDQLGVPTTVKRMKAEGETIPEWIEQRISAGQSSFYQDQTIYPTLFPTTNKIAGNAGASVFDIGDDVACFVFHSPKQAIGNDALEMLEVALTEVETNYRGLVVTGEGTNFSVGANLMLMLLLLENRDYEAIDRMILRFQTTLGKLRTCSRPVVAAPHGLTLGGGVEMCLPADAVCASAETYMGLVETGAGLIPAGGGCKEMLLRIYQQSKATDARHVEPFIYQLFETIGQAKVSTSALHAKSLGFLRQSDQLSMNRDYLIADAKRTVLALTHHYRPPQIGKIPVLGSNGTHTMKLGAYQLYRSGYISAHDYKIASKLGYVLAGGEVPENTLVSTNYLLELEREAFLSLIGEPKTQARMAHILRTGKPLRN